MLHELTILCGQSPHLLKLTLRVAFCSQPLPASLVLSSSAGSAAMQLLGQGCLTCRDQARLCSGSCAHQPVLIMYNNLSLYGTVRAEPSSCSCISTRAAIGLQTHRGNGAAQMVCARADVAWSYATWLVHCIAHIPFVRCICLGKPSGTQAEKI